MKICLNINCEFKGKEQPLSNFILRLDTQKYRPDCKNCYSLKRRNKEIVEAEKQLKLGLKICSDLNCDNKGKLQSLENYSFIESENRYRAKCKNCIIKYDRRYIIPYRLKNKELMKLYYKNYDKLRSNGTGQTRPEKHIELFLKFIGVKYIYSHFFKDCLSPKNWTLEFDFFLPDFNIAIEFDGPMHLKPIFGEEKFKQQLIHDQIKNTYCQQNNIQLIRISYLQNLEEELNKLLTKVAA